MHNFYEKKIEMNIIPTENVTKYILIYDSDFTIYRTEKEGKIYTRNKVFFISSLYKKKVPV